MFVDFNGKPEDDGSVTLSGTSIQYVTDRTEKIAQGVALLIVDHMLNSMVGTVSYISKPACGIS